MKLDTNTLNASLVATDIGLFTRLLFDADNNPVAVYAIDCTVPEYTLNVDDSVLDLSIILPLGRCLADDVKVSANGNVALFDSYEKSETPEQRIGLSRHSYTLDTAALTDFPDIALTIDDVNLSPLSEIPFAFYQNLSDNGEYWFVQQWFSGIDENQREVRHVGAVLWNTSNGDWLVRGLTADLRECSITDKNTCHPPYYYAMSDGNKQYFSYPGEELLNDGAPPKAYKTYVDSASTGSSDSLKIESTGTVRSLTTNQNGNLLVLDIGADDATSETGYALYQASSQRLLPLNRMLKGCPLTDSSGNPISESDCHYALEPFSTTRDPISFTADGKHVLFRFISRFTTDRQQSVDDFTLDIEKAAMYTLPAFYNANPQHVSGDGTVMIGNNEFPNYELLIGRR